MRIFILTLGTRGDFELFLLLGRELHRRGHRVILGTSPFYADAVRAAGLEYVGVGTGTREELLAILKSLGQVADRTQRIAQYFQQWVYPQFMMDRDQIQARAEESDYFICNLKTVLRRRGEPIPGAFVTYDPPIDLHNLNAFSAGLPAGRILDLVAMNRQLLDPQGLWGKQFQFTGFWEREPTPWEPPAELRTFLEAGPPPAVLTMGSMVTFDPAELTAAFREALRRAGQRGILVGGWSGIEAAAAPPPAPPLLFYLGGALVQPPAPPADPILSVEEVPYEWLFPRASCVLHHGGCGTVGAVLRAGKPSILLPQILPQQLFGTLLGQAGVAAGMFEAQGLKPADLADALRRASTDPQYREKGRQWQEILARDRGLMEAAECIEAHARQLAGPPPRSTAAVPSEVPVTVSPAPVPALPPSTPPVATLPPSPAPISTLSPSPAAVSSFVAAPPMQTQVAAWTTAPEPVVPQQPPPVATPVATATTTIPARGGAPPAESGVLSTQPEPRPPEPIPPARPEPRPPEPARAKASETPAPPAVPEVPARPAVRPKLLFVLSSDFGELSTAVFFVLGQPFDAIFLMPSKQGQPANNLPVPAESYTTPADVLAAVDRVQPDVVLLCSAYLYYPNALFTMEELAQLVQELRSRSCRLVTSDPFLGILAHVDETTFNADPIERKVLAERFTEVFQILKPLTHLYLVDPAQCAATERAEGFSLANLVRAPAYMPCRPELLKEIGADPSLKRWFFVLAGEDYWMQAMNSGGPAFDDRLTERLREVAQQGKQPVLLAPPACTSAITLRTPPIENLILLNYCRHELFLSLLLEAEYVFCWNIFSNSTLVRAVNRLPAFFFDPGYMARNSTPLYQQAVKCYFGGEKPNYLRITRPLDTATLAQVLPEQERTIERMARCVLAPPSPVEVVQRLLRDGAVAH